MRYLIDENAEPPGRISLRIVFQAGSLMEADGEEGIAHFLEHLAFNGTERFPEDEMIRYLQRLGMAFGPDTNANTGFDRTLYQLDLPDDDPEVLRTGLSLLRDYADRLLLLPDEIEQERGIILAEKQARDSVAYRTRRAETAFILDGLRYPQRWPIGTETAIRSVSREQFESFYRTWYRPERTILVVVGDVDPDLVEDGIESEFGDWMATTPPPDDPDPGILKVADGSVPVKVYNAAEAAHSDIVIYGVRSKTAEPDSATKRERETLEQLGHAILSTRFARIARSVDSVIQLGYSWSTDYYEGAEVVAVGAYGAPDAWSELIPVVESELRRALIHAFTETEFEEAVANLRNAARQAVEQAETRDSRALANQYANAANEGLILRSPEQELERVETLLARITRDDVEAAFRSLWEGTPRRYWVTGAFGKNPPTGDEVSAAFAASAVATVSPIEEAEVVEFPYRESETAGVVVEREEIASLGLTRITFENGLVAFLKPTDFEANTVALQVRVGAGLESLPEGMSGLQLVATAVWIEAGLGKLDRDGIERSLAGKTVGVDFSVGDDAFVLSGVSSRDDLGLQLRLATAYLTDPGYRDEAVARYRRTIPGSYQQLESTWRGALDREIRPWLRGGDYRFRVPEQAVLEEYGMDTLRSWIGRPLLDHGGAELVLVGDFELETTIDRIARTLGAVERDLDGSISGQWVNPPGYPEDGADQTVRFPSEVRQGLLVMAWPTGGMDPIERTRRLNLLAKVLDDRVRVKIRETFGDTYAYGVYNQAARGYDHGLFTIILQIDPDRIEPAEKAIREIIEELLEKGLEADAFRRAREPLLRQIETMERDNAYWLRVAGGASRRPEQLVWAENLRSSYEAITKMEIERIAEEVFSNRSPWVARIASEEP